MGNYYEERTITNFAIESVANDYCNYLAHYAVHGYDYNPFLEKLLELSKGALDLDRIEEMATLIRRNPFCRKNSSIDGIMERIIEKSYTTVYVKPRNLRGLNTNKKEV